MGHFRHHHKEQDEQGPSFNYNPPMGPPPDASAPHRRHYGLTPEDQYEDELSRATAESLRLSEESGIRGIRGGREFDDDEIKRAERESMLDWKGNGPLDADQEDEILRRAQLESLRQYETEGFRSDGGYDAYDYPQPPHHGRNHHNQEAYPPSGSLNPYHQHLPPQDGGFESGIGGFNARFVGKYGDYDNDTYPGGFRPPSGPPPEVDFPEVYPPSIGRGGGYPSVTSEPLEDPSVLGYPPVTPQHHVRPPHVSLPKQEEGGDDAFMPPVPTIPGGGRVQQKPVGVVPPVQEPQLAPAPPHNKQYQQRPHPQGGVEDFAKLDAAHPSNSPYPPPSTLASNRPPNAPAPHPDDKPLYSRPNLRNSATVAAASHGGKVRKEDEAMYASAAAQLEKEEEEERKQKLAAAQAAAASGEDEKPGRHNAYVGDDHTTVQEMKKSHSSMYESESESEPASKPSPTQMGLAAAMEAFKKYQAQSGGGGAGGSSGPLGGIGGLVGGLLGKGGSKPQAPSSPPSSKPSPSSSPQKTSLQKPSPQKPTTGGKPSATSGSESESESDDETPAPAPPDIQEKLIGLAFAEASKLFDKKGGGTSAEKQQAIVSAGKTVLKLVNAQRKGQGVQGANLGPQDIQGLLKNVMQIIG